MGERDAAPGGTALVVGATGFLGAALSRRLAREGFRVVGATRREPPPASSNAVAWRRADVSVLDQAEALVRATQPAIIFHLTSDSRGGRELEIVPASLRDDVVATVNMLYAAARADPPVRRFVMTGSLEEPSGPDLDAAVPTSPYAAAKWTTGAYGRMIRRLYGLDVRIVRLMMTYGPGQKDYKLIPATILALLGGRPARIASGSRGVDWIYLDDTIEGMVRAALVPALERTVDIGSGRLVRIETVAREIARQIGRPELLAFGAPTRGEEVVRAADTAPARALLGFEASVALEDGLARTIAWYRDRH
jgi:nucleoside-diphosphate-sugar epimerase